MHVLDRFLKYVSFDTQSDEHSSASPSTSGQRRLGAALAAELQQLGLENAHMDAHGYVYAWLPASPGYEEIPCLGFISHMDTAPAAPGRDIHPHVVHYEGGDLSLSPGIVMREADFESLRRYRGQNLVVTDGKTLLGADDKAGIAEIITAMEYLITHPECKHGRLAIAFTPDEEIGRGTDRFSLADFGAAAAYTVDGGELGEVEYENFNAAAAQVTIHGLNVHPGSAKNKMKNASLLAMEFNALLPPSETPSHTEGYEGFYHLSHMEGDETTAVLDYIVRDHARVRFEARKRRLETMTRYFNEIYGEGTVVLKLHDQYYNMRECIEPCMYLIDWAKAAFRKAGVEPREVPIRGGTDGARLSYQGLPCPNLSTGGLNFHGPMEYIPVQALECMVDVLIALAQVRLLPD